MVMKVIQGNIDDKTKTTYGHIIGDWIVEVQHTMSTKIHSCNNRIIEWAVMMRLKQ